MTEFCNWITSDLYLLVFPTITFILIYLYLDRTYSYWKRKGVPQVNPTSYIYGNVKEMFYGKEYGGICYQRIYNKLKGHPFGGFYEFLNPVLMVRDPQLIHTVLVEKFNHFHDNKFVYIAKPSSDDAAATHPFWTKGSRWKEVRSVVNSGFTPNKLRNLENIVQSLYKDMSKYLDSLNQKNIEANEVSKRFICEIVANWGWGIYANAFAEDSVIRNIFDKLNIAALSSSYLLNIWILWPKIGNIFNKRIFSKDLNNSLEQLTELALKNASNKNSYLQTILNKKEISTNVDSGKDISLSDTTGYMAAYYTDGYETTASLLNLVLHQLALYPNEQQKLRNEIINKTDISIDAVNKMEYMDMFISEVGRYVSPVVYIGRICTQKITLGSTEIEPGTPIVIPADAIHHDPEYYPDPYNFNPENFTEENKNKRHKCTNLLFGEGPRVCIGKKHSLITIKLLLCYLLKEYEILPEEGKTAEPLKPVNESVSLFIPQSQPAVRFKKLN